MRAALLVIACALGAACGVDSDVSRTVGAQCSSVDQCDERCLQGDAYPAGFCSVSCDDDADCPGSSVCVEREGGVCLLLCEELADCEFLGAGWGCRTDDARPGGEEVMVCRGDA